MSTIMLMADHAFQNVSCAYLSRRTRHFMPGASAVEDVAISGEIDHNYSAQSVADKMHFPTSIPAPRSPSLPSMLARALTWWTILRICIEERLVYRGDFWLGTLMRFLPIVTQIFLWSAVFAGMAAGGSGKYQIAGYTFHDFV